MDPRAELAAGVMTSADALWTAVVQLLQGLALHGLRVAPAVVVTPLFGGRALPAQARVVLVVALGAVFAPPWDGPRQPLPPLLPLVLTETAMGLVLALVLWTPFAALEHAGRVLDTLRGANASEILAPESGARSSPLSELFRWSWGAAFVLAGGLGGFLRVLGASYALVPFGAPVPSLDTAALAEIAARASAIALEGTVLLGGAGLVALVAAELSLGLAARLSPGTAQPLALPVRALLPLGLVGLGAPLWVEGADGLLQRAIALLGQLR